MKKYIIILLSGLGMLSLVTSCKNDLNLAPVSTIGGGNFFKTSSQFDAYMAGIHTTFRSATESFQRLGEVRADIYGTEPGSPASFTGEATQGFENFWQNTLTLNYAGVNTYGNFYYNIAQINNMIVQLNSSTVVVPATKSYYLGICYGMRAFYYFQLYRSWGNVPLTTTPITVTIGTLSQVGGQAPAASVMTQIKSDVDQSVASFAGNYTFMNSKGYWSLPATLMLKAEVYLWTSSHNSSTADATTALTALNTIQTSVPTLGLLASYPQVFLPTNRGNNEIIFAIHNAYNESTMTWIQNSYVPQNNLIIAYYDSIQNRQFNAATDNWAGLLRAPVTVSTFRKFNPLDSRRTATIQSCYTKSGTTYKIAGCFVDKYQGEQQSGVRYLSNDFPIYRYADLLLLKATAEVYLGQSPTTEINLVRARAFGANYNAATMAYPNQAIDANPREAILQERLFEFIFEGKRWNDLRSMGDSYVYEHTTVPSSSSYKLLWPIDQQTMINDPQLVQTPGYPAH
jgi:hypothetical protein